MVLGWNWTPNMWHSHNSELMRCLFLSR